MGFDFWLEKFKREAIPKIKEAYSPEKVLIFGSRIKGNADEDSDIDVIIVSDLFRDIPFIDRMPLLLKLVRFPIHIDFICYTPDEFERIKDKSSVVMDALETGAMVKI